MEDLKQNLTKFYISNSIDESDDILDENRVIEESPNGRWNKLATEISVQNIFDYDTINLAIDTEKGYELAWNEIHLEQLKSKLSSEEQISKINSNIQIILNYLIKLDHLNILTFYDYWYNKSESKWVVITELSTAGSLKKLLDNAKKTKSAIKQKTYKRWLNQLLNAILYIHLQHVSIFQGNLNTEQIFIQNNSAIKIAPSLLNLCLNSENGNNNTKSTINDILSFNDTIVDKDLHSLGLIAIEIFTAHLNLNTIVNSLNQHQSTAFLLSPSSPTTPSAASTSANIQTIGNIIKENNYEKVQEIFSSDQFNFVYDCINPNNDVSYKTNSSNSNNLQLHLTSPLSPLSPTSASLALLKKSPSGKKLKIEHLLYHPLVNEIYSLKVLSIYSLLVHFQDKHLNNKRNSNAGGSKKSLTTDEDGNSLLSTILNIKQDMQNDLTTTSQSKVFARKVSLNSFANTTNLPKDFFGILEDIKLGCYPRLYSHYRNYQNLNNSLSLLKTISSSNSINRALYQQYNNSSCRRPSNLNLNGSNLNLSGSRNNSGTSLSCSYNSTIIEEEKSHHDDHDHNKNDQINKESRHHHNHSGNEHSENDTDHFNPETRRIRSEDCTLIKNSKHSDMHSLVINLKFDDNFCRRLECSLSNMDLCIKDHDRVNSQSSSSNNDDANEMDINDIISSDKNISKKSTKLLEFCLKLTDELVEFGLVNDKDKEVLTNILEKTLVSCN